MEQKCLGCREECEMDFVRLMTGCAYGDGAYPKDAKIWYIKTILDSPERIEKGRDLIRKQHPDIWDKEEH